MITQEQFEIEAATLAKGRDDEIRNKLDLVSIEFEPEIAKLTDLITSWRASDKLSSDRFTTAYVVLLNKIPAAVLADNVIRSILESHLLSDPGSPLTYQYVVADRLILNRLRSLLPQEELSIPIQHKFYPIDLLVSRVVMYFPNLFIHIGSRGSKTTDTIGFTDVCKERLGLINIQTLLVDVPMFCKPQPWTSVFDGGFLTKELQRANPLISSKAHHYKDLRNIDKSLQESPGILEAVNKMQNVKYKVDKRFGEFQSIIDKVRKATLAEKKQELAKIDEEISALVAILDAEKRKHWTGSH